MNVDKPNPEMLIVAREAAGLTQTELAKLIGTTQARVSRYESGNGFAPSDYVAQVAHAVNRPASFFYWDEAAYSASCMFHRKRKTITLRDMKRVHATVNICRMQASRMLKLADVESAYKFYRLDMIKSGGASEVARRVRSLWQMPLGPVKSVVGCIERAGGVVFNCDFNFGRVDGISQWPLDKPDIPPVFFVNCDIPGDRARWTLAHEIGHVIMHHLPTATPEADADDFASEFLMPADEIAPDLSRLTLEKAAALKSHWKTSMQSIVNRAHFLGKITDNQRKHLYQKMSALGYRKCEPVPMPIEQPQLLPELIRVTRGMLRKNSAEMSVWLGQDTSVEEPRGLQPFELRAV